MTKHPSPTRADHLEFCRTEGWELLRSSRGRRSTHHETYELELDTGEVLRTRISRPPDRTDYGRELWRHILRDQLRVSEADFWRCVRDGVKPARPEARSVPAGALPTDLVWSLRNTLGLAEDVIARMTMEDAIAAMSSHWQQTPPQTRSPTGDD